MLTDKELDEMLKPENRPENLGYVVEKPMTDDELNEKLKPQNWPFTNTDQDDLIRIEKLHERMDKLEAQLETKLSHSKK
jgi:hypothetical protein